MLQRPAASLFSATSQGFGAASLRPPYGSAVRVAAVSVGPSCSPMLAARRALSSMSHAGHMRRSTRGSFRAPVTASSTSSAPPVVVMCLVAPSASMRLNSSGVPGADPTHEDLYVRLGVSRGADKQDIKKNYHILAKLHHPDQNQGDKAAEEKFRRIKEAYEILSDHGRRRTYDSTGSAGAASQGEWKHGSYTYTAGNIRVSPMRLYIGIAATIGISIMFVRWFMNGTAAENMMTFFTMLAFMSFFPRIVGVCLLFYFYAPSQQVKEKLRRGASDTSTIVVTTYVAPNPKTRPTRVVRLTGVDKVMIAKRSVEFTFTWPGMGEGGKPLVLSSRVGEAHIQVPDVVPETGCIIRARTMEDGAAIAETAVDLS